MATSVRVSAPGKTILMGEHAAVYDRPALVAAVDRRATATLAAGDAAGRVRLELPQVGVSEETTWDAVLVYSRRCRDAWRAYSEDPGPEAFARVRGDDPAHLVKIALGEAALHVGDDEPPPVDLRLDSEIPTGAGFGSSAAAAVATVDAYLALRGAALAPEELHRLTLEVERRQHGLPSGVDNATVIHGGLVWAKKEEASGRFAVTPLAARSSVLEGIRVFHSGPPAETTGAVVAAVRRRKQADPQRYESVFDRMEAATWELRRELEKERASPARMVELLRGFEACLEQLGVVPEPIREVVRRVERQGGAAKISGAGALTGRGAGALLVYHPDPGVVDGWDFLDGLERLDLRLGAEGVRRSPPSLRLLVLPFVLALGS
jgi:mevalonate kinase